MVSHLPGSSGSDASVDEKKRRRMISNRESARRSRMKKQKHLQDLISETGKLEMERNEIVRTCDAKSRSHLILQAENGALVAEKTALTNYLNSINAIIGKFKEKGWLLRESSEFREPWQFHCTSQHITTSTSISYL